MARKARPDQYLAIENGKGDERIVRLKGAWTVYHVPAIERAIRQLIKKEDIRLLGVDLEGIGDIDTAGAWLIKKYFRDNDGMDDADARKKALLDFLPDSSQPLPKKQKRLAIAIFFVTLGRRTEQGLSFVYALMCFVGRIALRFLMNFASPRRFRFPSIIRHIDETGLQALPIIALLAALMSMVICYQAAIQLQKFGADVFTIDLSVISILREMGVLITAIMVAGRSGSAFAAEIGVMKLREEVDALKTMGLDPIETLVLPRLIALVIALPLLTFLADLVGMLGGAVLSLNLLDIPFHQYFERAASVATPTMFFVGMIKAPVFALLIGIIGTYQGMSVSGSAESVGRLTTVAVVQSIFLVIMADALFSVIFQKVGI
jgi:phospholipid/cholesterol/gamma-HCH transport system permease protein